MSNIIAVIDQFVDSTLNLCPGADRYICRENVCRHGTHVLSQPPDVRVMDTQHTIDFVDLPDHLSNIHIARRGLEQDVDRLDIVHHF